MTNLQKLKALLWGSFWAGLGGITTGTADIVAGSFEAGHVFSWDHVLHRAYVGIGIGIFTYWQQQKALFTPPPVLVEDTIQTLKTPPGQDDVVLHTHKETTTKPADPVPTDPVSTDKSST